MRAATTLELTLDDSMERREACRNVCDEIEELDTPYSGLYRTKSYLFPSPGISVRGAQSTASRHLPQPPLSAVPVGAQVRAQEGPAGVPVPGPPGPGVARDKALNFLSRPEPLEGRPRSRPRMTLTNAEH